MSSGRSWEQWLAARADERERAHLRRALVPTGGGTEPVATRGGAEVINLASNNYLGLAGHPALVEAALGAAGSGAGSSRLLVGHDPGYAALEEKLADFKGTEGALVFGSGYGANVGLIPALVDGDTEVFSDELNHASIIDGVRLARASVVHRYRHADSDHLEGLLEESARSGAKRRLIVSNTVFSMDGDVAPLARLVELKDRYGAALLVDEAHGGGVYGPGGRGLVHELGLQGRVELVMGTFSKAFGVYGAYVVADRVWIEHLVNTSRTLIYSTGLPPGVVASIAAAIDLVEAADDRRRSLHANASRLRDQLVSAGLDTGESSTQIVPVLIGESEAALAAGRGLLADGVLALPIREPTVPAGSARLRMSVLATHTHDQLDRVAAAVQEHAGRRSAATIVPR